MFQRLWLSIILIATLCLPSMAADLVVGVAGEVNRQIQESINHHITRLSSLTDVQTIAMPIDLDELFSLLSQQGAPDILVVHSNLAYMLAHAGAILPLDPIVSRDIDLRHALLETYPVALESSTVDGSIFGIPRSMDLGVMMYHREFVRGAGLEIDHKWDWEAFATTGRKLNALQYGGLSEAPWWLDRAYNLAATLCLPADCWMPFVWSNGGDYIDGQTGQFLLSSPESLGALEWLQDHVTLGSFDFVDDFASLRILEGMAVLGPALSKELWLDQNSMASRGFDLAITLFPQSPTTDQSVTYASTHVYVINIHSSKVDAAVTFLKASLLPEIQRLAINEGSLPVTPGVLVPEFPGMPPYPLLTQAALTAKTFIHPWVGDRWIWEPTLELLDVMHGNTNVQHFVDQVEESLRSILR